MQSIMELDDDKPGLVKKRSRLGPLIRTDLPTSPSPSRPPSFSPKSPSNSRPRIWSSSSWRELTPGSKAVPPPMSGLTASYYNRIVLVFGGYNNHEALADLWAFDLETQRWSKWETTGTPPSARTSHSAVVDPERGRLYIGCGSGSMFGHTNLGDFYVLDIELRRWHRLEFTGDQSLVIYKEKLIMFGGTFGREFSQDLCILDLETLESRKVPVESTTPTARYKHSAGVFDTNKMLVFGGAERMNYKLNDVAVLNLDTLRWSSVECSGAKPGGRFAHSMSIANGKAFVFGGTDRESCQSDLFILDIDARVWTKLTSPGSSVPRGRYFHGSVYDDVAGDLIIWGGKGATDAQVRFRDLHAIRLSSPPMSVCTMADDLGHLLTTSAMSDLRVTADDDGSVFLAHQLIVRARCAASTPMLTFDGGAAIWALPWRSDVVEQLLWFLYSDLMTSVTCCDDDLCFRVLQCAESLGIDRLVALCERRLRCRTTKALAIKFRAQNTSIGFRQYLDAFLGGEESPPVVVPRSRLCSDLGWVRRLSLHQAEHDAALPYDYRFQCAGERIGAHQVILAARSQYFGSFSFLEGMREAATRVCWFPGNGDGALSGPALGLLLDYLYGGKDLAMERVSPTIAMELVRIDVCNYFGLSGDELDSILSSYLAAQRAAANVKAVEGFDGSGSSFKRFPNCMLS